MIQLDQNRALSVLEKALDPSTAVVDGRTEKDFLRFMADFASLINFYDHNNEMYGDWRPLVLKDPVILLAYIASTKYDKKHNLFLEIAAKREVIEESDSGSELTAIVNTLFDLYVEVFRDIEQWTYYMKRYDHHHHLRKYLFHEVKQEYAPILWAMLQYRDFLHGSDLIDGIKKPKYYYFEDFDPKVWNDTVNSVPFSQSLDVNYPLENNTKEDIYDSLISLGDKLLGFYKNCIDDASEEFSSIEKVESRYPDTILIRVFAKLFSVYTEAMNGLSQKHLEFYFRDILKQREQFAEPDQVFIAAAINSKTDPLNLPQGTQFKAGLDANKQPILFETLRDTSLNPAKLGTVNTMYTVNGDSYEVEDKKKKTKATKYVKSFFLSQIPTPTKLQKDEKGKVLSWPTFGGTLADGKQQTLAMAIASPMFLLEDGTRTLNLTFTFEEEVDPWSLINARHYLSTQKAWLEVTEPKNFPAYVDSEGHAISDQHEPVSQLEMTINIDPSHPAIQPFKKNPDGYTTSWPLLKIEFSEFANLDKPPRIKTLKVESSAKGMQSIVLENDHGKLSAKKPFEPLGPAPAVNSNFFLGSAEIFSKPFNMLSIEMDWDALPTDFKKYYDAYNQYLEKYDIIDGVGSKSPSWFRRILERLFGWATSWNVGAFQYTNRSFRVEFGILQDGIWGELGVEESGHAAHNPKKSKRAQKRAERREKRAMRRGKDGILLFKEKFFGTGLNPTSYFNCPDAPKGFVPKPELQVQPLKYSATIKDGFTRMTLVNPGFGFGLDLYAKVVAYLALVNAKTLIQQIGFLSSIFSKNTKIKEAANKPYNPKLKTISVSYDANHSYDFSADQSTTGNENSAEYPIQCFHYTPFATFKSFDNSTDPDDQLCIADFALSSPLKEEEPDDETKVKKGGDKNYLPVHVPFQHEGALFMEYTNLIGNAELNLFFELSRKIGIPNTKASIEYSVLTDQGWEKTPVIIDETQDFICSGILDLNIPMDVSSETVFMPEKKFWVSIGVDEQPDTFAHTTFLNSNGLRLQRCSDGYLQDSKAPRIATGAISTPAKPIPQIGTIVQPFASFGGKKAEDETAMFHRVSNHLAMKGRVSRQTDYFRMIKESFSEIYYVKVIQEKKLHSTKVLLVRQIEDVTEPSAFLPLVSECTEIRVQEFLESRTSVFSNISAANFSPVYLTVKASIVVKQGVAVRGLEKEINAALNLFLSPWIQSTGSQIKIDQGVSEAQVSNILRTIEGVLEVDDLSFIVSDNIPVTESNPGIEKFTLVLPEKSTDLFVPAIEHQFTFRAA